MNFLLPEGPEVFGCLRKLQSACHHSLISWGYKFLTEKTNLVHCCNKQFNKNVLSMVLMLRKEGRQGKGTFGEKTICIPCLCCAEKGSPKTAIVWA